MVCLSLYAEDDVSQNRVQAFKLPPLISDTYRGDDFLSKNKFLLPDGTYVGSKELKFLLSVIPSNEEYLCRAQGGQIAGLINADISMGALVGTLILLIVPDIPNKEILGPKFDFVSIIGCVGGGGGIAYSNANLRRAVKNYNFSIMGISVE
jgi:hypothetical protein